MQGRPLTIAAGLHVADGRLVVDRLRVHRADEGDVIHALRRHRQQLGVHPEAALTGLAELELGRRDREAGLA